MTSHLYPIASEVAIIVVIFLAQALKELGIPSLGLTHSLLLYAGYQISVGNHPIAVAIILFTFLGSLCGAFLIFVLARRKSDWLLAWLSRHGLIKAEAVDQGRRILTASSFGTVAIGRSLPGMMLPTSIAAGIMDFSIHAFLSGIVITLSIWVAFIVAMGTTLNYFIPQINISSTSLIGFPLIILAGGLFLVAFFFRIRKSRLNRD